jgi:hypothetical protein
VGGRAKRVELQRWRREEESTKRGTTHGALGQARDVKEGGSPQNIRGVMQKRNKSRISSSSRQNKIYIRGLHEKYLNVDTIYG